MAEKPNSMITVKGAGKDNRVVLWEIDKAHPNGQAMIANDGKAHTVEPTAAVRRALESGALVQVQAAPVNRTQTPNPKAQGGKTTNDDGQKTPGNPLGANTGGLDGLGLTAEQEKALTDAGYADRAALTAATDDDLIAVSTIGKATVENLRKALASK